MPTATLMDSDMSAWPKGTRHYRTDDGDLAVESSDEAVPAGAEEYVNEALVIMNADVHKTTVVLRPTVVFVCNEDGSAIDLTPIQSYPAGTTHEQALAEMGYQVV